MDKIKIPALGAERLRKLEAHLRSGKLGHAEFDFGTWNNGIDGCGTAGCAVGECPILFPQDWKWTEGGFMEEPEPVLIDSSSEDPADDSAAFFCISIRAAFHLFVPQNQDVKEFGGQELHRNATRYDVADQIAAFLERCEIT